MTSTRLRFKDGASLYAPVHRKPRCTNYDSENELVRAYADAHGMAADEARRLVQSDSYMVDGGWVHVRYIPYNADSGYSAPWGQTRVN